MRECNLHVLNVYHDATTYVQNVSRFFGPKLLDGYNGVAIVSSRHHERIMHGLAARGVPTQRLHFVGAESMAAALFPRGEFDLDLFEELITKYYDKASSGAKKVAVVGEIVDVLWKDGRQDDAILVEQAWNGFITAHDVALMCSYFLGGDSLRARLPASILMMHSETGPPVDAPTIEG